jgi:hypothetical protein
MEKTAGEHEYTSLADYTLRTAPWRVISYSFASGAFCFPDPEERSG